VESVDELKDRLKRLNLYLDKLEDMAGAMQRALHRSDCTRAKCTALCILAREVLPKKLALGPGEGFRGPEA